MTYLAHQPSPSGQCLRKALVCGLALMATLPVWSATTERPDESFRALLREAVNDSSTFEDQYDAQVWLVDMSHRLKRKMPDDKERLDLLKLVHAEAHRVDLPPELILAVIDIESNFDRYALSYAGARGMMQIMPFWLKEIGRPDDNLFDVPTNLRFGCTILRLYIDRERGDLAKGLARYNGSVGRRVYSDKVLKRLRERWYKR
ncbi:MAG: lytic transglycosylase domain-containing protein [Pseudomonadota bacterium]